MQDKISQDTTHIIIEINVNVSYLPIRGTFHMQAKSIHVLFRPLLSPGKSTPPTHRPMLLRARTKYRTNTTEHVNIRKHRSQYDSILSNLTLWALADVTAFA